MEEFLVLSSLLLEERFMALLLSDVLFFLVSVFKCDDLLLVNPELELELLAFFVTSFEDRGIIKVKPNSLETGSC